MRNMQLIRELKRGERVNVKIAPMCIFLFRDGTVISIHRDTHLAFTEPITERLRQRDTGLRTTADPSLLVESLIDLGESTHRSSLIGVAWRTDDWFDG